MWTKIKLFLKRKLAQGLLCFLGDCGGVGWNKQLVLQYTDIIECTIYLQGVQIDSNIVCPNNICPDLNCQCLCLLDSSHIRWYTNMQPWANRSNTHTMGCAHSWYGSLCLGVYYKCVHHRIKSNNPLGGNDLSACCINHTLSSKALLQIHARCAPISSAQTNTILE